MTSNARQIKGYTTKGDEALGMLVAFVRLDFVTVKPYFTIKNIIMYIFATILMAIMTKSIISTINLGMVLATLNIGYPFALGEKSNIDALYIILGMDRKTVVRGRYIFSLLLNICAIFFMSIITLITVFFTDSYEALEWILTDTFGSMMAISVLLLVVQSIQIPMYFKIGYTKAKLFSILPIFLIYAVVFFLVINTQVSSIPGGVNAIGPNLMEQGRAIIAVIIIFLLALVFASYKLSLLFYKKREF